MRGPLFPDASSAIGGAIAPLFPRRSEYLKLRIWTNAGEEIVKVPNPDWFNGTVHTREPDALPTVKETPQFTMTLFGVKNHSLPGRWEPDYKLSNFKRSAIEQKDFWITYTLEDLTGNRQKLVQNDGGIIFPSEPLQKLSFAFWRTDRYPWRYEDAVIIAEGTWGSNARTAEINLLAEAKKNAVDSIRIEFLARPNEKDIFFEMKPHRGKPSRLGLDSCSAGAVYHQSVVSLRAPQAAGN
jgi:hypothetical protein